MAQQPFEDGDEIEQLLGAVIAEIVDPVGNPIRGRAIVRGNRTRDDVVDVGEVAALLAVTVDRGLLVAQHDGNELGQHSGIRG